MSVPAEPRTPPISKKRPDFSSLLSDNCARPFGTLKTGSIAWKAVVRFSGYLSNRHPRNRRRAALIALCEIGKPQPCRKRLGLKSFGIGE
jgi:hypothetical protein